MTSDSKCNRNSVKRSLGDTKCADFEKQISSHPDDHIGPVRVGARSGLGPIWAHKVPYGPDFVQKHQFLMKNHKNFN